MGLTFLEAFPYVLQLETLEEELDLAFDAFAVVEEAVVAYVVVVEVEIGPFEREGEVGKQTGRWAYRKVVGLFRFDVMGRAEMPLP